MSEKKILSQPLMMRKDYGNKEDKEALMLKEVPIEDYDKHDKKKCDDDGGYLIMDYDKHGCEKRCFLCDR